MKRLKAFVLTVALLLALVGGQAHAIDLGGELLNDTGKKSGFKEVTETSLAELVGGIVQAALGFIGILFTLLVVYGGHKWMMARGESGEVEAAQTIITNSVIGLVVVLGAYSISSFVIAAVLARALGN